MSKVKNRYIKNVCERFGHFTTDDRATLEIYMSVIEDKIMKYSHQLSKKTEDTFDLGKALTDLNIPIGGKFYTEFFDSIGYLGPWAKDINTFSELEVNGKTENCIKWYVIATDSKSIACMTEWSYIGMPRGIIEYFNCSGEDQENLTVILEGNRGKITRG